MDRPNLPEQVPPSRRSTPGYKVEHDSWGYVVTISCVQEGCRFGVSPRAFKRPGDRSGQARYNRARAEMLRHLKTAHGMKGVFRALLPGDEMPRASSAPTPQATRYVPGTGWVKE